jgi:hypothetical protein
MDMSIFKDTRVGGLSEGGTVQFRAEFFNTFNTPQFASQTTTQFSTTISQIGAPTFGHITATTVSPRHDAARTHLRRSSPGFSRQY